MPLLPLLSLLVVGAIIVGAGLVHLDRADRRRLDARRQEACRWHQWQAREVGAPLVCALCGRRSGAADLSWDPSRDTPSSDNLFFP